LIEEAAIGRSRCFHHGGREAVGQCTDCSRSFCRECFVEHEGRLLCAPCLERLIGAGDTDESPQPLRRTVLHVLWAVGGFTLTWLWFVLLGLLLVNFPDTFHNPNLFS